MKEGLPVVLVLGLPELTKDMSDLPLVLVLGLSELVILLRPELVILGLPEETNDMSLSESDKS